MFDRLGCSLGAGMFLCSCGPLPGELDSRADSAGAGCSAASATIEAVQGRGAVSPLDGHTLSVTGVVTLLLSGRGFFLQSEVPDADPETSGGLFVVAPNTTLSPGKRVHVRGQVRERDGSTELAAVELLEACGNVALEPAEMVLTNDSALEPWEHALVAARAPWTLIDSSARSRGSVLLSSQGRLYATGHELGTPTSDTSRRWRLEDPRARDGDPLLSGLPERLGAQTERIVGVVQLSANGRKLLETQPSHWQTPEARAPEPPAPSQLRIAALNVDNYFVELGGLGAASESELARQRTKLVAVLQALHADLLALTEIGNSSASLEDLAASLNQSLDPLARYTWSSAEPPPGATLRAAILYRPARLVAVGEARFELSPSFRRPPVFQTFQRGKETFTLGVVHLKSKRCDGELAASELEGCGASARAAEAAELARVLGSFSRTGEGDRALLIGDFNADARETPLLTLTAAGLVDLLGAVSARERYSYVFDGRAILLDHALATASLATLVRSANIWHVNADEPSVRDYSLENPPNEYRADATRSSDHDPILVDLEW